MTTRIKKSSAKKTTRKSEVKNAKKTLTSFAHTWNQVAKGLRTTSATAEGRNCLKAINTLGVHMTSIASLTAADIFTAWWGGLKSEGGDLQMWKTAAYLIEIDGEDKTLYTLKESGEYKRVSVFTKKTIISETDKRFDKKQHIAPTTDVAIEGLAQCALCDTWSNKVAKAAKKADDLVEGFVNIGTSQQPVWTKVRKAKDGKWCKVLNKAKKSA